MADNLVQRLEAAVARLEALSAGGFRQGVSEDYGADAAAMDASIVAFDDLVSQCVNRVTSAGEKIGWQVQDVSRVIAEAFKVEKELLVKIKQNQKPDMAGLGEFLKPLNDVMAKASALTEGRRSNFFIHLKTGSDSLAALAWIAYTGKDCGMSMPTAHVEESWQMAEFYCNKILVEYRNKDANHVEWAKALKELYLPGLRDYVKKHYPLGPVWSATGKIAAPAPAKASTPGAPAPPPPPPASLFSSEALNLHHQGPRKGCLLSSRKLVLGSRLLLTVWGGNQILQMTRIQSNGPDGAIWFSITSIYSLLLVLMCVICVLKGLRKVTDDMKSKNRADRSGVVTISEKDVRASSIALSKTGPPKLELQMGRKWVVENQIGNNHLVIEDCDAKQSVYIYGCKNSVLHVQGKVNNITVDKCSKMGVVFKDVVAACEIVNCSGVEVQCQGSVPTVSVDNTAGCQLYLSKDALEASITTAKSTEVNVLVPGSEPDDDWAEEALPQQYIHVYKDGQFVTTPVSHSGA